MAPKLSGTLTFPFSYGALQALPVGMRVGAWEDVGVSHEGPPATLAAGSCPRPPRAAVLITGHCCDFLGPSGGEAVMRGLTETQGFPRAKVRYWTKKGVLLEWL